MSKNDESQLVVASHECFAAESFLTLHVYNIEYDDKQDTFTNTIFEAVIRSIKNYFFNQRMVYCVNKLELSDKKVD